MAKINVSKAKQDVGLKESYQVVLSSQDIHLESELAFIEGPITVRGTVVNNGRALEVTGVFTAGLNQTCNRCLKSFLSKLEVSFTEYFQEGHGSSNYQDVNWYQGDEIDLTEVVRENLLLALPIKVVCSESCQGLCPVCGVNLNKTTCSCNTHQVDPRLAVLKKFMNK